MKIVVIDDKPEELEKAIAAVEAAGHDAIPFSDLKNREIWSQIEQADGVITDLYFDPRTFTGNNQEACEIYRKKYPPSGLVVAIHALHVGKKVVICTDGLYHKADLGFIWDGYLASVGFKNAGIVLEHSKRWDSAVEQLMACLEGS